VAVSSVAQSASHTASLTDALMASLNGRVTAHASGDFQSLYRGLFSEASRDEGGGNNQKSGNENHRKTEPSWTKRGGEAVAANPTHQQPIGTTVPVEARSIGPVVSLDPIVSLPQIVNTAAPEAQHATHEALGNEPENLQKEEAASTRSDSSMAAGAVESLRSAALGWQHMPGPVAQPVGGALSWSNALAHIDTSVPGEDSLPKKITSSGASNAAPVNLAIQVQAAADLREKKASQQTALQRRIEPVQNRDVPSGAERTSSLVSPSAAAPGISTSRDRERARIVTALQSGDSQPILGQPGRNRIQESPAELDRQKAPRREVTRNIRSNLGAARVLIDPSAAFAVQPADATTEVTTKPRSRLAETVGETPSRGVSGAFLARTLPSVPFAARTENFAFAMHLRESNSSFARPQGPLQPASTSKPATENQHEQTTRGNAAKEEPRPVTAQGDGITRKENRASGEVNTSPKVLNSEVPPSKIETAGILRTDLHPLSAAGEQPESAPLNRTIATADIQAALPDPPKNTTSPEIHLHLASNDQSSATIRVTDRGGAVNISVHASDPLLRNSLRANLSDLSGQLTNQGWKTEIKAPPLPGHNGGSPDSSGEGRNSSNQQPKFTYDERQPQRDRRGNGSHWQNELDEEMAGNGSSPRR
jgi:hypothetical protein